MHGKTSPVTHDGTGLFEGLPSPFTATRYHSLIVEEAICPPSCSSTRAATTARSWASATRRCPIHGVQFHPESIATEHGHAMLANFLRLAGMTVRERQPA